jgi:hypothetical protein
MSCLRCFKTRRGNIFFWNSKPLAQRAQGVLNLKFLGERVREKKFQSGKMSEEQENKYGTTNK